MAAKQPQGKRRPSTTSGVSRSYSQMYKNATAAGVAPAPLAPSTPGGAAAARGEDVPMVLRTSDEVDWKAEYGYVLADLRTLGLVTLGLVIAIVVVGLFL